MAPAQGETTIKSLCSVVPGDVRSRASYFEHVAQLFAEGAAEPAVVRFSRLAIEAAVSHDQTGDVNLRQSWLRLFKAHLALGEFDDAFQAMMSMSEDEAFVIV